MNSTDLERWETDGGAVEFSRLTIVDESGRVYERWDVDLEFSSQDGGRTLKVFVKPKEIDDE
jgi:hypothetical protein